MKKILLFVLILSIVFSNVTCFAFDDISDTDTSYAVDVLSKYSIINGYDDGTFRPNENITRAEFTKIMIYTGNLYCQCESSDFSDIKEHWAEEYINMAYFLGMVNGTTSTTFSPNDKITYEQAAKIIVSSLGYDEEAKKNGGYPVGYMTVAENFGIFDNISVEPSSPATRGKIAMMINQSLDIERKVKDSNGETIYVATFRSIQEDLLELNGYMDSTNGVFETETDSVDDNNSVG